YDGATLLGTAALSGSPATATFTTAALAVGTHMIRAHYSGDSLFAASDSGFQPASVQSIVPASGLYQPEAVAVDGRGGAFIADTGNNRVVEVKPDGTQTTIGSGLNQPVGVAVDGAGDVFIAESENFQVVEVPANGGIPVIVASGFMPGGVAVDGAGDLFIV